MKINKQELSIIIGVVIIFSLRMLGIFMILPILTVHGKILEHSNEYLIGIAIGIYGIMQVIFQLPFGIMSDKIGKKSVIIGGLILFTIGSEIAAVTNNIWGLIIGRTLQGSSAISSVLMALLLDSIQEKNHSKIMAIIGLNFGIVFSASIILSPIITNKFGLFGLFQIITLLSILAIIFSIFMIPSDINTNKNPEDFSSILKNIKKIVTKKKLIKLNLNIFYLHIILILNFIVFPKIIINLGFSPNIQWKIYSIIMILSFFSMLPYIFYFSKKYHINKILHICVNFLFLSEFFLLISFKKIWFFLFSMQIFFIIFSLMESILPSLINKESSKKYKGTTLSIYSISQFLGIGFGGILGGMCLEIYGISLVLIFAAIISILCILTNHLLK